MNHRKLIIAIDGPSGAGKSTVGKELARRLGYLYIDTGAMYRAVALKMKERGLGPDDDPTLQELLDALHLSFLTEEGETRILCNGEDLTHAIRSPEISRFASDISRNRIVREALVRMQREMGKGGGVVLEGRDVGTVVFPNADLKFYLDAEPEERGRRRYRELLEKGLEVDLNQTVKEIIERDRNDMSRSLSPLKRAEDAIFIDSTHRSVDEIVGEMHRLVEEKR